MENIEEHVWRSIFIGSTRSICNLMNYKHKPRTRIKDHMLIVMGYLDEVQNHGFKIDANTQMELIF